MHDNSIFLLKWGALRGYSEFLWSRSEGIQTPVLQLQFPVRSQMILPSQGLLSIEGEFMEETQLLQHANGNKVKSRATICAKLKGQ